jgi:hypothetical protein
LPSNSTWTLDQVLTSGLQEPKDDVTSVQVEHPNGKGFVFEPQLSKSDVFDGTTYRDPYYLGAVPVIASNGPSGPNYYERPYRGGSDDNSKDTVNADDAIHILVWIDSQPLAVTIRWNRVSSSKVKLSATVRRTAGSPELPLNELSWQWTFLDGSSPSEEASPTHTSSEASYNVNVVVTDHSLGAVGTDTTLITSPTKPAPGKTNQTGGSKPTSSNSPTGKDNGGSNQTPGTGGHSSGGSGPAGGGHQQGTQPSSQTTTPGRSTSSPTSSTPGASHLTTPAGTPAATTLKPTPTPTPPPERTNHQNAPPAAAGPLVKGRLIADVTSVPESSSPLVRAAAISPAPTVRQATSTSTSPLAAIAAGLGITALLGLGAWHELRGRRSL